MIVYTQAGAIRSRTSALSRICFFLVMLMALAGSLTFVVALGLI